MRKNFCTSNPLDKIYTRNLLLREFKLTEPYEGDADLSYIKSLAVPDELVTETENYAARKFAVRRRT